MASDVRVEFRKLGEKLIVGIIDDTVLVVILVKSDKWDIDEMVPGKFINSEKMDSLNKAISDKIRELNKADVVNLIQLN